MNTHTKIYVHNTYMCYHFTILSFPILFIDISYEHFFNHNT